MKLSVVIPHYPRKPEYDSMLKDTVASLKDADEIIISISEGTGMGRALNFGFNAASGDFLLMCSNDCKLSAGNLKDLCDPDYITVPNDVPGQYNQPRSFFCMPRWIWEKGGNYDEQFVPAYFEDDDMINRWRRLGVKVKVVHSVEVAHIPGTTMDALPNRNDIFNVNKVLYLDKWGYNAMYGPDNSLEIIN